MTWVDWLKIAVLLFAISVLLTTAVVGLFWLCTEPMGHGPKRLVDIHNRGLTRIQMPDGTIK